MASVSTVTNQSTRTLIPMPELQELLQSALYVYYHGGELVSPDGSRKWGYPNTKAIREWAMSHGYSNIQGNKLAKMFIKVKTNG